MAEFMTRLLHILFGPPKWTPLLGYLVKLNRRKRIEPMGKA